MIPVLTAFVAEVDRATVPLVTRPRLERAVTTSPVCWATGVALKNPSFCPVAVPILSPVVVSVTIDVAFRVIPLVKI